MVFDMIKKVIPLVFNGTDGKEIATLNDRVSPVDVYKALYYAYGKRRLGDELFVDHTELLFTRGLLHQDMDWDLYMELKEKNHRKDLANRAEG